MNDTGVTFGLNPTVGRGAPGGRRRFLVGQRNPVAEIERCCWPSCSQERYPESDAPPLCGGHLVEAASYAVGEARTLMTRAWGGGAPMADPHDGTPDGSVVYYVRIGDHVKIGTTTDLGTRLKGLHALPGALLASNPSRRLLDHIQTLQPE